MPIPPTSIVPLPSSIRTRTPSAASPGRTMSPGKPPGSGPLPRPRSSPCPLQTSSSTCNLLPALDSESRFCRTGLLISLFDLVLLLNAITTPRIDTALTISGSSPLRGMRIEGSGLGGWCTGWVGTSEVFSGEGLYCTLDYCNNKNIQLVSPRRTCVFYRSGVSEIHFSGDISSTVGGK